MASCAPTPATNPSPEAGSKPLYGALGYDSAGVDKATKAGDDFFRFANGAWLDHTEIPADKPGVSLRLMMADRTEGWLHDMMEQAAAHTPHEPADPEGKMGAFYKSFIDEARVEQLGAKPITAELADVRTAKSRDDLAALMGRTQSDFEGTLFNFGIDVDLKDPNRYAVYVSQGGLGLPDRDYYLKPNFAEQKKKYSAYVGQLLQLMEWPDANSRARDVVDFQTKIAGASWTKAQQRDMVAVYNPMTVAELQKFTPGFAWAPFWSADRQSCPRSRGGKARVPEARVHLGAGPARDSPGATRLSHSR
jgi:putative endopeptidase